MEACRDHVAHEGRRLKAHALGDLGKVQVGVRHLEELAEHAVPAGGEVSAAEGPAGMLMDAVLYIQVPPHGRDCRHCDHVSHLQLRDALADFDDAAHALVSEYPVRCYVRILLGRVHVRGAGAESYRLKHGLKQPSLRRLLLHPADAHGWLDDAKTLHLTNLPEFFGSYLFHCVFDSAAVIRYTNK